MYASHVRIGNKLYELKEVKNDAVEKLQLEIWNIANDMFLNRIVVLPKEREKYFMEIAKLCYDYHSPFNTKGPLYFARLLFLSVDFRISEDSDESMDVQMIDIELQKYREKFHDD